MKTLTSGPWTRRLGPLAALVLVFGAVLGAVPAVSAPAHARPVAGAAGHDTAAVPAVQTANAANAANAAQTANAVRPASTAPSRPVAEPAAERSGAPAWVMIIVGSAVGIGIGMLIVFRAKRKYPDGGGPGGPARRPGRRGSGRRDAGRGDRG